MFQRVVSHSLMRCHVYTSALDVLKKKRATSPFCAAVRHGSTRHPSQSYYTLQGVPMHACPLLTAPLSRVCVRACVCVPKQAKCTCPTSARHSCTCAHTWVVYGFAQQTWCGRWTSARWALGSGSLPTRCRRPAWAACTHACTQPRTHARTHARTHERTNERTHARAHMHALTGRQRQGTVQASGEATRIHMHESVVMHMRPHTLGPAHAHMHTHM